METNKVLNSSVTLSLSMTGIGKATWPRSVPRCKPISRTHRYMHQQLYKTIIWILLSNSRSLYTWSGTEVYHNWQINYNMLEWLGFKLWFFWSYFGSSLLIKNVSNVTQKIAMRPEKKRTFLLQLLLIFIVFQFNFRAQKVCGIILYSYDILSVYVNASIVFPLQHWELLINKDNSVIF